MTDHPRALRCPCGVELIADDAALLLARVRDHLGEQHPRLVGAYSDEDVLSMAYRKPAPKGTPP